VRFAARVRAWPLARPRRPARRAGRGLRRSRVGPEDRFCEAVRNDLRVPLTLEGPARTMRGVPAPVAVTFPRRPSHLAWRRRPGRGCWRAWPRWSSTALTSWTGSSPARRITVL